MAPVTTPAAPPPPAAPQSPWRSWSAAWGLIRSAAVAWQRDNAMRLSAAVAMYSILSLAPLLVVTIKVTSLVLNEHTAAAQVERQVRSFLGPQGAQAVADMVTHTLRPDTGVVATALSLVLLLYTASGVFVELRDSLHAVWGIAPKPGAGVWAIVRDRLLSFGMVFAVGFLLLVSMVVSTVLTAVGRYAFDGAGWVAVGIDAAVSTLVITILFAALFRFLPDARLKWRDVLFGSAVTAVLFKAGQYVQALYFAYGSTASAYGAAGSFVVILLWVYYSCWILFFGAELIQEFARSEGRWIRPAAGARLTPEEAPDGHTITADERRNEMIAAEGKAAVGE